MSYRIDTRTMNALLTTTLDDYSAEMADTIFGSHYAYYMFKEAGCFKSQDGGAFLREPVMFEINDTVDWVSGYQNLNTTPQDGMTDGIMPWATMAGTVTISREEERMNSGKARLMSLIDKKLEQLNSSLIETMNAAFFGLGKFNAAQTTVKQMAGLMSLIPEDPTAYDAAGLSGAQPWWQNKVTDNAGSPFKWVPDAGDTPLEATGPKAMRRLYNNCTKSSGGSPDIILSGQYMYESYEGGATVLQRYSDDKLASVGFDNVKFKKAKMSWDQDVMSSSITKAEAAASKACAYFINTNTWEIVYDSQSLFSHEGFREPHDQLARTAPVVFMGNQIIKNRRKNGIMVDANIIVIE